MAETIVIPKSTVGWTEVTSQGNQNIYIFSTGTYGVYIGADDPETDNHDIWPNMNSHIVISQPAESIWLNGYQVADITVFKGSSNFSVDQFSPLFNAGAPD